MKKCVKKIPKYSGGIPGATAPSPQELFKSMNTRVGGPTSTSGNGNIAGDIAGAIGAASGAVANAFGIEQGKNAAIFNAVGDVAPMIPGVGLFLGPALKTVGAFAGEGGGVDQNTGEVTKSSGLTRVFGWGRDDKAMAQESNRIKMANASRTLTENLRTDYYNNTRGVGSINVLAAEGGIMRQPVDALVSKGELIYNPVTKKLSQVPGSKGKPNKADDVYAKLYEGDVVISNSPTMLMANGKTPAQNLMGMVDKYATGGTVKAREAIIKKVVNWQEANKTKPQEYAKFDEGYPGFFKYLMDNRTRPLGAVMSEWFRQRGEVAPKFDGFGKLDFLNGIKNIYNTQSDYEAPIKLRDDFNWNQHRSVPIDQLFEFNPNALATKVEKPKNTSTRSTAKVNYSPQNVGIHTHSEIDPVWSRHKTNDNSSSVKAVSEVVTHPNNVNDTDNNISTRVQSENGKNVRKKPVVTGTIKNPILPEYDRLSFAEPFQFNNQHLRYAPGNYVPIKPLDIEIEDEIVDEVGLPKDNSKSNINWGDLAYKAAVLTQPLWGRAKAEPVNYTLPNAKYIPVGANVKPLYKQADETHSMGRYNFANLGGNTGANMAYGAQLAANRAKQYADAYQWQQNIQNNQIAKNIGIYNDWDTQRTEILNNVYDKNAANRATARNINKQNAAAALKNWGTMLSDDKKMAVERMKFKILQPAIRSTYEDATANDLINIYNSLFGQV